MRKQVLSAALAAALLAGLAGCANTPAVSGATPATAMVEATAQPTQPDSSSPVGSTTAMGRWVSEEIDLGGAYRFASGLAPACLEDGQLVLYGTPYGGADTAPCRFTSLDNGASWQSGPTGWEQTVGGELHPCAVSGAGSTIFTSSLFDPAQPDSLWTNWLQPPGGEPQPLDLSAEISGMQNLLQTVFMDETTLLLSTALAHTPGQEMPSAEDCVFLFTLTDGSFHNLTVEEPSLPLTNYFNGAGASITADGGPCILYLNNDENLTYTLCEIDQAGAVRTRFTPLPNISGKCTGCTAPDGSYYFVSAAGLYRLAPGGTLPEEVIPGVSINMGSLSPEGLCRAKNGDFILTLGNPTASAANELLRLHWDESLPAEKADSLIVWSLNDNKTVRAALTEYAKTNPEVAVDYQIALTGAGGQSTADLLRTLNTELLSGAGPDILIFDGADYQPYLDKGLLADLSPAVDTGALVQNIAAPFIGTAGKIGVIPARFGVPLLIGDVGSLDSLTSLDAMQQAVLACPPRADMNMEDDGYYIPLSADKRFGLSFLSVEQLLQFVMETSAPALVQNGAVNTDAVRQVLGFAGSVGSYYGMKNYRPADQQPGYGITSGSSDGADAPSTWDNVNEYTITLHARYGWSSMLTPGLLAHINRSERGSLSPDGQGEWLEVDVRPRPGLTEGAYLPITLAGVNAASSKQAQALDFIRALLSESVQNTYTEDGLPVRQSALTASIARNATEHLQYRGDVATLIAACKTPVIINDTLNAAMLTHAKALIDGAEDLNAAVSGVEGDLGLYLAERQ